MAGLGELFDPIASAIAPDTTQIREGWSQYLNDPTTQAALLSFGAQAAQPRQWGQSDFGHLMSSVAQGGAGVRQSDAEARKAEELDIKRGEAESKQSLRESNATLAESRAANAGTAARGAEDRLVLRQQELDQRRQLQQLQRQIQGQRLYQDYVRRMQKENENNTLFRRPAVPVQSFEEWLGANPMLMQNLGLSGSSQSPAPGDAGGGPTPGSPSGATPAPSPAAAPQGPPPPAASRPDGFVYNDPQRGQLRWNKSQQRWFPVGAAQ